MMISCRNVWNEECRRQKLQTKFKKHTFCVQQRSSENRPVYEITWKNMVEPDRPQITTILRRMLIAWRIIKATDTPSEYVILIAFLRQN
jgi:hypothetical protein